MSNYEQMEESKSEVRQEDQIPANGENVQERLQMNGDGQAVSNQKQGRVTILIVKFR
jgi:hypothetical protein